ncbi:TPA: RepB family plasmid replication initiator protein [Photobacterium damselae]
MAKKQDVLKQPNSLTAAVYNLNRNQKRVFYSLIQGVMANSLNKVEDGYELQIVHSEYASTFGSDNASREIGAALREFNDNKNGSNSIVFLMPDEDVGDDIGIQGKQIVTGITHRPKSRCSSITVNNSIYRMLKDTDAKYTMFLLSNAGKLQNPYAMRLYETICQWRSTKVQLKHACDWIRDRFCMPSSYKIPSNFRNKFLIPAVKEINEQTDIILDYEELFEGDRKNSVSHILFKWKEKGHRSFKISESFEPSLENAVSTYSKIINKTELPTKKEIDNLTNYISDLVKDGFIIDGDFFALMAKASAMAEDL